MNTTPIQHSYRHYGSFIREYYGPEAYKHWLSRVNHGKDEQKPHVCTPEVCGQTEQEARHADLKRAREVVLEVAGHGRRA